MHIQQERRSYRFATELVIAFAILSFSQALGQEAPPKPPREPDASSETSGDTTTDQDKNPKLSTKESYTKIAEEMLNLGLLSDEDKIKAVGELEKGSSPGPTLEASLDKLFKRHYLREMNALDKSVQSPEPAIAAASKALRRIGFKRYLDTLRADPSLIQKAEQLIDPRQLLDKASPALQSFRGRVVQIWSLDDLYPELQKFRKMDTDEATKKLLEKDPKEQKRHRDADSLLRMLQQFYRNGIDFSKLVA